MHDLVSVAELMDTTGWYLHNAESSTSPLGRSRAV